MEIVSSGGSSKVVQGAARSAIAFAALLGGIMIGLTAVAAPAPAASAPAASAPGPMPEVQAVVNQAVAVLKDPHLSVVERRRRLRDIANAHLDFPLMARSSLGYQWDELSPAEQQEFSRLFSSFIEDAYLNKIQGYVDLTFKFSRQIMTGVNYAQIDTSVLQPGSSPISLNFHLRRENGDWKVYDIVIDDISMVENYRNQFNRVIKEHGFNALMVDLRRKDQQLTQLLGTTQGASH
jgi:phospholipid transport system substrate-binding protein